VLWETKWLERVMVLKRILPQVVITLTPNKNEDYTL
jgi:hypothetical protein